jgi:peptidoglycan/LPS O-acetylase OafA/YrhL
MDGSHLRYRAEIDGLRAVAVLAVLFFHAGIGFPGGYVGVDVFFVISGYLITGLILKELDSGQFQILSFWERRMRRILPALVLVVAATLIGGWFLFTPQGFKELGQSVVAQAMLASNFYFWFKSWIGSGYFERPMELKPLLHTWSLAVEEQFYLIFPLLLIWCKRCSRTTLQQTVFWLGCASFGLSVYCSYFHRSVNFYLLPTRAWELLTGSFVAAIPARRMSPRWVAEALSWGGLLAIGGAVFFYDRETPFPGINALAPCIGTALVIWTNGHSLTSIGRLLAAPPIVFLGLVSYSLYLWHWPVLVFSKYWAVGPLSQSQRSLLLFASLALAVLSWRFVETPFRKRTIVRSRPLLFGVVGVATALLLFAGLAIHRSEGLPSRLSPDMLRYAAGEKDRGAFLTSLPLKNAQSGDLIELGAGDKLRPVSLLVWGDSHAMATMSVLDALCKEHSIRGVAATHSARPPLVGYERQGEAALNDGRLAVEHAAFNRAIVEFVRSSRVGDVVLIACWGGYLRDGDGYLKDGEAARLRRGLLDTIILLKEAGARIWIMKQVPRPGWNVPQALTSAVIFGRNPEALGLSLSAHREASQLQSPIFEGLTNKFSGVSVLDPTDLFVAGSGRCRVVVSGKPLYWDDHHLSVAGAMLLRPLFEPIYEGIGKGPSTVSGKNSSR